MKASFNEKLIAYLTLISGLSISAVAVYYSVMGLISIFSAAVIPIFIMGVTLEISKLIATLWLKQNWKIAPLTIKIYLSAAILILMLITSMGIFGFLSKSHSDQGLVTGNNTIQINEINRQIAVEKRNIDDANKVISQLDQSVQALIDANRIRGSTGSIAVRKNQSQERDSLNKIIAESTTRINKLEAEKLPLEQQRLNIEAEVGPIKYIAAFIYGDNPDKSLLEKAVTWVIVIIVCVFDPLAIVLLLASQLSFQYFNNQKLKEKVKIEPPMEEIVPSETIDSTIKNNTDDFDLKNYPYLFDRPKSYHPPGVEPVGPQVYNTTTVIKTSNEPSFTEPEKLFIQNEEQKESNLWTSTNTVIKNNPIINEVDYKNISKEKLEEKINYYANMLRDKKILATEIPVELLQQVKARV